LFSIFTKGNAKFQLEVSENEDVTIVFPSNFMNLLICNHLIILPSKKGPWKERGAAGLGFRSGSSRSSLGGLS
jgi:hypothetical protein